MCNMKVCMDCKEKFERDFSGSEYCKECRKPHVEKIAKECRLKGTNWCHTTFCKWYDDCPNIITTTLQIEVDVLKSSESEFIEYIKQKIDEYNNQVGFTILKNGKMVG